MVDRGGKVSQKTNNLLIVGGYLMSLPGDPDDKSWRAHGDSYWTLADVAEGYGYTVRLRECIEDWFGRPPKRYPVTIDDLRWATHIILYSYGGASAWHLWHNAQPPIQGVPYELLVKIATVPDAALMQFYPGLWHAPKFVRYVRDFDVRDIPASCTLKDCPEVNFGDTYDQTIHGVTIRCDSLFPAVMTPGDKHIGIKDHPEVLTAIAALLQASIPTAPGGATPPLPGDAPPASGGGA